MLTFLVFYLVLLCILMELNLDTLYLLDDTRSSGTAHSQPDLAN